MSRTGLLKGSIFNSCNFSPKTIADVFIEEHGH